MNKAELIEAMKDLPDEATVVAQTHNDIIDVTEVIYYNDGLVYLKIY